MSGDDRALTPVRRRATSRRAAIERWENEGGRVLDHGPPADHAVRPNRDAVPPMTIPHGRPSPDEESTMRMSDENLRGRAVIASDGIAIGEIALVFIDADTWRVESIQLRLRSEIADRIGADRGVFHAAAVDVPVAMVQSVGDAVVLAVPVDDLRRVLSGATGSAAATT